MNFDYNEEQQLLADSVRRFLQKDYDFETRKKIVRLGRRLEPEGMVHLHRDGAHRPAVLARLRRLRRRRHRPHGP